MFQRAGTMEEKILVLDPTAKIPCLVWSVVGLFCKHEQDGPIYNI